VVLSGANGDAEHPEADVQDADVCHAVSDFTSVLTMVLGKKLEHRSTMVGEQQLG